jgi:Inhibitor of Apoptosis domain
MNKSTKRGMDAAVGLLGNIPTVGCTFRELSQVERTGFITPLDPSDFIDFEKRYETFENWPGPLTPFDFATTGFIYRKLRDQVQCFSCFVAIEGWQLHHSPIEEHKRHSPNCRFIEID